MTVSTDNHEGLYSQEPEIVGNSGNSGNDQQKRGLQPFPPYKKVRTSGNTNKYLNIGMRNHNAFWLYQFPQKNEWEQPGNAKPPGNIGHSHRSHRSHRFLKLEEHLCRGDCASATADRRSIRIRVERYHSSPVFTATFREWSIQALRPAIKTGNQRKSKRMNLQKHLHTGGSIEVAL